MANALKRIFERGEWVYVVDYRGTNNGTQAFDAVAEILRVDKENETFNAVLYGNTFKVYSFKDYGRLIFDTRNEAIETADKLPKPKTTVYQIIGKRVCKRLVDGIGGNYTNETFEVVVPFDLMIHLNKGKAVSTKEIGHTLFLNKTDAKTSKK